MVESRVKNMLISNPHTDLRSPGEIFHTVRGEYRYYHYACDAQDDRVNYF